MKKLIILFLLSFILMNVMAKGTLKDAEKAYNKAIKEGLKEGYYILDIYVDENDYVEECLKNHHCICVWTTNHYVKGKNYIIYFFISYDDQDHFEKQIVSQYFHWNEVTNQYSLSDLKRGGQATIFFKDTFKSYDNIWWSGRIVNGKLDGKGLGVVFGWNGDNFTHTFMFTGEFKEGMPIGRHDIYYLIKERQRPYYSYLSFHDHPDVIRIENLVDPSDEGKSDMGFFTTDLKIITPFAFYFMDENYAEDGFRKVTAVEKKKQEVVYLDHFGKRYTYEETGRDSKKTATINKITVEHNTEDYSFIPDFPFEPRKDSLIYDEAPIFSHDDILYFPYENNEAVAKGLYKSSSDVVAIPSTVTNPSGKKYKVTEIGSFEGTNISSIFIPKTVVHCGRDLFYLAKQKGNTFANCTQLEKIIVEDGNSGIYWGDNAFSNCKNLKQIVNLNTGRITQNMFNNCTSLKSIKLPVGVKVIDKCAFKGCSLDTLTIPNTLMRIDPEAFEGVVVKKLLYIPFLAYACICNNQKILAEIHKCENIRIRDDKYQMLTVEENYSSQCRILDKYRLDLIDSLNRSYATVNLNDQLLEDFKIVYGQTAIDKNKKSDVADMLLKEHKVIRMLRNKYYGYHDNKYGYNYEIDDVIDYVKKPSSIGFNKFHQTAKPILEKYQKDFAVSRERLKQYYADLEAKRKEEERRREEAFNEKWSNSSSSSSSSSDDNDYDSSEQEDGNSVEVPEIKSIAEGSHSRFFDSDDLYIDNDSYEIKDGGWTNTFIKVYHVYSKANNDNYYYPENNKKQYHYRTAEDAARAGWVWEKKGLVRTIGMIDD